MEIRTRIVEAGNTCWGFPMLILARRGFTVIEPPCADRDFDAVGRDLHAFHPDGTALSGSSPIVLLGLLSIIDHLGPDWYTNPNPEYKYDSGEPYADVIDLAPEILEEIEDHEIEPHIQGFRIICDDRGFTIDPGSTRESLVAAAMKFIEMAEEYERRAQED